MMFNLMPQSTQTTVKRGVFDVGPPDILARDARDRIAGEPVVPDPLERFRRGEFRRAQHRALGAFVADHTRDFARVHALYAGNVVAFQQLA